MRAPRARRRREGADLRRAGHRSARKHRRSRYLMDPDCLFCKIVAGEIPSTRVYEDERTIAFMDINPGTRGHLLVIPREHARDLLEIEPEDLAACARTAKIMATRVSERLQADGVNVI